MICSHCKDGNGGEPVASNRATEPHIDALDDIGSDGEHLRVATHTTLSREALRHEVMRKALLAARPHVQFASMHLPIKAAEDCAKTLDLIDAAIASPLPKEERQLNDPRELEKLQRKGSSPLDTRAGGRDYTPDPTTGGTYSKALTSAIEIGSAKEVKK